MRKTLAILALTGILSVTPALTPAAHAGGFGWLSVGTGFRVGGLNLSLVFGRPFGYAGYYYRFPRPIAYRGVHCTSRCFLDHGVFYHDRNCPLVGAYFRSYGYDPYQVYSRYAPSYDAYYDGYDGGYYDGGYYDGGGYYADPYYGGGYYGGGVVYYNRGYSRHYDSNRYYNNNYYNRDRSYDRGHYGHGYSGRGYGGGYGHGGDHGHGQWDGRHDGGGHGHGDGGGRHDGGKGQGGRHGHH